MPEFRRPPDWDQRADRGTRLTDPVVTVRQLSRFGFARRPLTRIDHALVFSAPDGTYDTYLPPVRPSRAGAAAKRYTSVYEVDIGVHPMHEEIGLPSDDDAFEFGVTVELSWQVVDPARFVMSRHRDVPRLLIGEVEQAARPVTRRHSITRSADAEQALLREVRARGGLGAAAGLAVSWTARVRGDQGAIDHVRRMRAIDHEVTERIQTEWRGREHDAAIDRRSREQDALQWRRAAEFEEQEHAFNLRRQEWQHAEAVDRSRRQLALQQVNAEKIAFYEKYLEQGGVRAWALHLADHPDDTHLVVQSLREDQLRTIRAKLALAGELLNGDSAENHELETPKKMAFQAVIDVLDQYLPGVTAQSTAAGRLTVSMPQDAPFAMPGTVPWNASPPDLDRTGRSAADGLRTRRPDAAAFRLDGTPLRKADAEEGMPLSSFPGWRPPPGYGSTPLRRTDKDAPSSDTVDGPRTAATRDTPAMPGTTATRESPNSPGATATPETAPMPGTPAAFRSPNTPGTTTAPRSPSSSSVSATPQPPDALSAPSTPQTPTTPDTQAARGLTDLPGATGFPEAAQGAGASNQEGRRA
ncbi:hypothetical protein [Streptomyces sp. NPDC006971]|uniref:hypothetical protein n=1 Tax=Streptomyces sp. NPDC006971 TaxID=3154784 RepID=UPI0033C38B16